MGCSVSALRPLLTPEPQPDEQARLKAEEEKRIAEEARERQKSCTSLGKFKLMRRQPADKFARLL